MWNKFGKPNHYWYSFTDVIGVYISLTQGYNERIQFGFVKGN